MDELIQQISSRTGLSQDQSRAAAETCIGFLKDRMPGPAGAAIDQALGGGQGGSGAGQAADAARSMFDR